MKKLILTFILLLSSTVAFAKIKVLTTTTTLKSIVQAVGQEKVEVLSITKGPQDPHFVEAKPSYMIIARDTNLLVAVGLDLEIGWLPNITRGSRNPQILKGASGYLEAGAMIEPIDVPGERSDRSQGDIHAFGNPHFTLDPVRAGSIARGLAKKLGMIDPENLSKYLNNAKKFEEHLNEKLKSWRARIEATGVKRIISYHKTLNYFLKRFDLELADSIEPKPGIPPTAKHIMSLIKKVKTGEVSCILVESFFETNAADRIKKSAPVYIEIVATEVEATKEAENYEALIESLVKAVENCGKFAIKGEE